MLIPPVKRWRGRGGATGAEVAAWRWIWLKKDRLRGGGTHLSPHRAVDSDDDEALDGVKDSKEDLRRKRRQNRPREMVTRVTGVGCIATKRCEFKSQGDHKCSRQFGGSVSCWTPAA